MNKNFIGRLIFAGSVAAAGAANPGSCLAEKQECADKGMKAGRNIPHNGKPGFVSIIMPAFNCERFIGAAIESVLAQSYTEWELLVVDDCSSDRTYSIVWKYSKRDRRIILFRNKANAGAAASRNRAVRHAKGQYIAFLDGDDVWKKDKLEKQVHFMQNTGCLFSCTSYDKIGRSGKGLGRTVHAFCAGYEELLRKCPGNSTVMYDAGCLGKYTIPLIKKRNDYVMWLRIIKDAGMLYGLDEVLSSHRIVPGSISYSKAGLVRYHWIVYRHIEKAGIGKSIYLICYWSVRSLFGNTGMKGNG